MGDAERELVAVFLDSPLPALGLRVGESSRAERISYSSVGDRGSSRIDGCALRHTDYTHIIIINTSTFQHIRFLKIMPIAIFAYTYIFKNFPIVPTSPISHLPIEFTIL